MNSPIGPANQRYINAGSSTPPSKGPRRWPILVLVLLLLLTGGFLLFTKVLKPSPEPASEPAEEPTEQPKKSSESVDGEVKIPEGYAWSGTSDAGYQVYFASLEDEDGDYYPHGLLVILDAKGNYADSYVGHWVDSNRGGSVSASDEDAIGFGFVTDTERASFTTYDWISGKVGTDMTWDLLDFGTVDLKICDASVVLRAAKDAGVDVDARFAASEAGVVDPSSWKHEDTWIGLANDSDSRTVYAVSPDGKQAMLVSSYSINQFSGGLFTRDGEEEGVSEILLLDAAESQNDRGFSYGGHFFGQIVEIDDSHFGMDLYDTEGDDLALIFQPATTEIDLVSLNEIAAAARF